MTKFNEYLEMIRIIANQQGGNFFITDLGRIQVLSQKNLKGKGVNVEVPRYGVWSVSKGRKPEVVETGNDLDELKKRYKID